MKNFFWNQAAVWLIVAAGLAIFAILTVIIGQSRGSLFKPTVKYRAVFKEARGIYAGSEITIHGKRTGNVVRTKLLPSGDVEAVFTAQKSHAFIINKTSRARLRVQGALGDRYIDITTEDLSAEPLPEGALLPSAPAWDIVSLLTGGSDGKRQNIKGLLERLGLFIEGFGKKGIPGIVSAENKKDLTEILKTAKRILKKIDSGKGSLGALVNDRSVYEKAESVLGKIDSGEGSLGAIINSRSVYSRLLAILGEKPRHNYLKDLSKKSAAPQKKE